MYRYVIPMETRAPSIGVSQRRSPSLSESLLHPRPSGLLILCGLSCVPSTPEVPQLNRFYHLTPSRLCPFHVPLSRNPAPSVPDLFRSVLLGSRRQDELKVMRGRYWNFGEYSTSAGSTRPRHQNAVRVRRVRYHRNRVEKSPEEQDSRSGPENRPDDDDGE